MRSSQRDSSQQYLSQQYVEALQNSGNSNSSSALPELTQPYSPPAKLPPAGEWAFLIGFIAIAWTIAYGVKAISLKRIRDWYRFRSPMGHIPCSNCRFFNQSPYLKCAVHPMRSCTLKAVDCSDYWSKHTDKFSRK
ncbi:MAG: hypothetical protein ACFE0I_06555 [Elainellaceae cyanobacterium]